MQKEDPHSFTLRHRIRLALGPGLLLAGAAIGVSHLVQATRAGATYGFALWWVLALAIISKYPFLEFGPRYAAATGTHMITGYRQMHRLAFYIYLLITVGTMFIIQTAVTWVTAGLAEHLFGVGWSDVTWTAIVLGLCIVLLLIGHYPGLDISMKIIISVLTACTILAVALAWNPESWARARATVSPNYWTPAGIGFIIAFIGWMPIPLDASVWHSIWTRERSRQMHYDPSPRDARFDFNIGYGAAALIGILFFLMGLLVMFGSGDTFASGSVAFSAQIIDMYRGTLGTWSAPLIALAAFITMFSTTLAVTDIYPRVLSEFAGEWSSEMTRARKKAWTYHIGLIAVPAGALGIMFLMSGQAFTRLIDFAAGLSCVTAPILAWINLKLVTGPHIPRAARPSRAYVLFSWCCLVFLTFFVAIWFYHRYLA